MPDVIEAFWQERLKNVLWTEAAKFKKKRVLCAHNVVTDYIEFINPEQISALIAQEGSEEIRRLSYSIEKVETVREFLAALAKSMREGKSAHYVTEGIALFAWLDKTFAGPDKRRVGGQAGIIANQLAALGVQSIVVSPILSRSQSQLFLSKGVRAPVVRGKRIKLENVRNAWRKGDPTKINWIFEYKQGATIRVGEEIITAPRANRIIVASAAKYIPAFSPEITPFLPQLGKQLDAAVVAGYHHFQQEYEGKSYKAFLKQECSALQALRKNNRRLMVHFEYVPIEHKKIERDILRSIASSAGSFGVNEVEVVEVLEMLGFHKEASAIQRNECALTLYHGAKRLLDALRLQRVHLHAWGYYVVVFRKPYRVPPDHVRNACLFANCVANVKALTGRLVTLKDLKAAKIESLPISTAGFNQFRSFAGQMAFKYKKAFNHAAFLKEGFAEFNDHCVLIVPTQLATRPISTVGLGDVISSCALLAET